MTAPRAVVRLRGPVPDLPPGSWVRVDGDGVDPVSDPGVHDLLARLDARDLRAVIPTGLAGLDDDRPLRPFLDWDVRLRARLRADDAHALAALRNLQAFAVPFDVECPAGEADRLPDLVAAVCAGGAVRGVRLTARAPGDVPGLAAVARAVRALDARRLSPPPRLVLDGVPALALPVEDLAAVDVRTDDGPDAPWPDGVDAGPDTRARRRVWLATAPSDRPCWRGDALDRFADACSVVAIRPPHAVVAVVDRRPPTSSALAHTERFALWIAGRFDDPALAARFAAIARAVRDGVVASPPADLARLRALAHVLRRSMKPAHDGEPPVAREA